MCVCFWELVEISLGDGIGVYSAQRMASVLDSLYSIVATLSCGSQYDETPSLNIETRYPLSLITPKKQALLTRHLHVSDDRLYSS